MQKIKEFLKNFGIATFCFLGVVILTNYVTPFLLMVGSQAAVSLSLVTIVTSVTLFVFGLIYTSLAVRVFA